MRRRLGDQWSSRETPAPRRAPMLKRSQTTAPPGKKRLLARIGMNIQTRIESAQYRVAAFSEWHAGPRFSKSAGL